MEYRIDKERLLDIISAWDSFLKRRVHLIACGGTALTLLGIKASTKDIGRKWGQTYIIHFTIYSRVCPPIFLWKYFFYRRGLKF
ncbi:MAG: hypothetical protein AABY79_07115 [Nitrospirota bacterium]